MGRFQSIVSLMGLGMALAAAHSAAIEPADPAMIPEARKVLDYLATVYGKNSLTGIAPFGGGAPIVLEVTGREPAIITLDAFGWNKPKFGPSYRSVMENVVEEAQRWWHEKGGIVAMQFHWGKPGDPNGAAWVGGGKGTGPVDMAKTVTPGTPEHAAMMDDLRQTADYLEQLAKDKVPILWRPLHEIDGGWFWWTDQTQPENTAKLYQILFEYLVKERGLHNLVWVWNPAHVAHGAGRNATLEQQIAYRKRFYPGDAYVDIAGMDVYPNEAAGWGRPWDSSYKRGIEIMQQLAPGKIIALCECAALPNPDLMLKESAMWLYCLPWFATGNANPAQWMRTSYSHDLMLTLDELPQLAPHNIAPNVRITQPADGAEVPGPALEIKGVATDRDRNLDRVEILAVPEPWRDWYLHDDERVAEVLGQAKQLGQPTVEGNGAWTLTADNFRAGCWNLVAIAYDKDGVRARSNFARVTVGAKDLARGAIITASSKAENAASAVDSDLFTSWSGEAKEAQWLSVDLGATKEVGAVVVAWWKAFASDYEVQVSADGQTWQTVGRVQNKRSYAGDSEVFRFAPVQARYVRVYSSKPGTSWGGYTVQELRVFAELPKSE